MRWTKLFGAQWPLVLVALAGCGTKAEESPEAPTLAECDAYVATFARCASRGGAPVEAAVASQTEGLRAQLMKAASLPGKRDEVRARCAEGTKVLTESCR